jgi:hypothetical protein
MPHRKREIRANSHTWGQPSGLTNGVDRSAVAYFGTALATTCSRGLRGIALKIVHVEVGRTIEAERTMPARLAQAKS